MIPEQSEVSRWLVSDKQRVKAKIRYELNTIEFRLARLIGGDTDLESHSSHILVLIEQVLVYYSEYMNVQELALKQSTNSSSSRSFGHWTDHLKYLCRLINQRQQITDEREEKQLIGEIIQYYCNVKNLINATLHRDKTEIIFQSSNISDPCNLLAQNHDINLWLHQMLELWNHLNASNQPFKIHFNDWSSEQIRHALDFVTSDEFVDLANSLFFFKLFPDKLLGILVHPEKLVSVRMRIGVLHSLVEKIQIQLFTTAKQLGLNPGVDYFFHGDDLPQGIIIEVSDHLNQIIQSAVKHLNFRITKEDEHQITLERLNDLRLAYKFWFNPNRLIDATMVLHQRLVKKPISEVEDLLLFQEEMQGLYGQLTTSECLDLYGYFSNKDTQYLLYTFYLILEGQPFEWLPPLTAMERSAIAHVFQILKAMMEALRHELQSRHVITDAFIYNLAKEYIHPGRRNREAVYRVIAIYGCEPPPISDSLEKLFCTIEQAHG